MKLDAFGWVIGFFVVLSPLHMIQNYTLIAGLIHGIIGLLITIWILEANK